MDTLGTEIGQKMRSAVKAKLIELGTGSGSGFIDDELPDYVMIMVANKRSRQQMVDDLSLFLGAQTEVFVNWLHQVLQKLQEVTLPASVTAKSVKDVAKKKSGEPDDKRRERKRKDKKNKRHDVGGEESEPKSAGPVLSGDDGDKTPPHPATGGPPLGSITEVFAHQYIEKAKKSIDEDAGTSGDKKPSSTGSAAREQQSGKAPQAGPANISSIADIASATVVRKHHKELCELAEIQQRISEAKRHLKSLGTDVSDDDDEDLLSLKLPDDSLLLSDRRSKPTTALTNQPSATGTPNQVTTGKQRQRITMAAQEPPKPAPSSSRSTTPPAPLAVKEKAQTSASKRSVLDRLGTRAVTASAESVEVESSGGGAAKQPARDTSAVGHSANPSTSSEGAMKSTIISLSAHRREEREIYVPLFRRKEHSNEGPKGHRPVRHERARSRERNNRPKASSPPALPPGRRLSRDRRGNLDPGRPRDRRSRSRDHESRSIDRDRSKNGTDSARNRIGSRVIVLPPKPEYNEDIVEVPVASVIKVQPRPIIPKAKQPSKNLLLKAMAEAQRSTVANLRKTIDNTVAIGESKEPFLRVDGKRKLLIEISGNSHSEVEVQYEDDEDAVEEVPDVMATYHRSVATDEEVHEVDIANQVLMDDSDEDDEFKEMLEAGADYGRRVDTGVGMKILAGGNADYDAEPSLVPGVVPEPMDDDDTKFVVTLDGGRFNESDSPTTPSHTPPPTPVAQPGAVKLRLSVKERIGVKQQKERRASPTSKDSKEFEETLKKRKERFSVKPAKTPPPLPPPPTLTPEALKPHKSGSTSRSPSRGQRSPKPFRSHSSSQGGTRHARRTPSLSPERPVRRNALASPERSRSSRQRSSRMVPTGSSNSPSHLNELLLQRTKELMDDSVSSSPIYMSKTDYDKMEPASRKRKRVSPIQFNLTDEDDVLQDSDDEYRDRRREERNPRRSRQRESEERAERSGRESRREWERDGERRESVRSSPGRKIKKLESSRKFDDIPPLLSAISVSGADGKAGKPLAGGSGAIKERCKYFPSCRQGETCEFLHPTTPCKAFPGCKFGDKCLYLHPMCKYDLTCHRLDCNFMHSKSTVTGAGASAPPLASSVVPVQNYKTISAKPLPPLCKYYPNCSNTQCTFYHPKMCRFGRHCVNKVECNFYHYELPPQELHDSTSKDKFKWISPFSA
ncbi:serine/arginine repetitive matrix protein 1 [Anopheles cruzii]|uniref:serine/arginine repetitive matrix protein 1 n=1 Tax=Anopheles cruzii TaxID=68878 RepID=UPI0022EC8010|nr:serine/arginine repetitive matrix protein 1 [Anopheles cruzii]